MRKYFQAAPDDGAAAGGGQSAPQAAAPENLIDAAAKPAAGAPAASGADPAAANAEWFWADGVKGADKRPDWLKADKYKTVADQAKAYVDLEKKHGEITTKLKGFAGAPEKYELTIPETLKEHLEWLPDDPLLGQFQTIAREAGMSQQVFEKLLHTFAQYEYQNMAPDWAKEKIAIGDRADERLGAFWDWAGANLDEETATTVKRALGVSPSPAEIFLALESVQNAGRQPRVQNPGDDVKSTMTQDEWNAKWYAKSEVKGHTYKIDEPGNRERARAELQQIVGAGDHKVVVGKRAS